MKDEERLETNDQVGCLQDGGCICASDLVLFYAIVRPVVCWGDGPRECHLEDAQRRFDPMRFAPCC